MQNRRDNGRGGNDFRRNAESIFREHLQNDPRFGGGWAHDWDSNPRNENGAYRGGPRRMHWSDDRDYSSREGHGYYADEEGGTVYDGGNRGRRDYGHGSSYGRRGYYDRGSYYEDASRYSPRFHERREYDQYDRREEMNGRPQSPRMRYDDDRFDRRPNEAPSDRRADLRSRQRDGYDPRDIGSNDRRDRWTSSYGRDQDSRYGADYSDDIGHEHWYRSEITRDPRYRRDRDRYGPGDPGGQFGGRNTW